MLLGLLLGVLATLIVFPESPIARTLHRHLVETAARSMSRVRFGHMLFGVALAVMGTTLVLMFEG